MHHQDIAKQILADNHFMSLATTDGDTPWVCPLFFAVDADNDFYFVSGVKTLHVQNVLKNPKVALTIFDSHATSGSANGVYVTGECYRVTGAEVSNAIKTLYGRRYSDKAEFASRNLTAQEFSQPDSVPGARHLYRIIPERAYVLDKTQGEDARIEVELTDRVIATGRILMKRHHGAMKRLAER